MSAIKEALSFNTESGLARVKVILRVYSFSGFAIAMISLAYFLATKLDIRFDRKDVIPLALAGSGFLLFLISRAASEITSALELQRSGEKQIDSDRMKILYAWKDFESASARRLGDAPEKRPISARYLIQGLLASEIIKPEEAEALDAVLSVRNSVAHSGPQSVNPGRVQEALTTLRRITARVNS